MQALISVRLHPQSGWPQEAPLKEAKNGVLSSLVFRAEHPSGRGIETRDCLSEASHGFPPDESHTDQIISIDPVSEQPGSRAQSNHADDHHGP